MRVMRKIWLLGLILGLLPVAAFAFSYDTNGNLFTNETGAQGSNAGSISTSHTSVGSSSGTQILEAATAGTYFSRVVCNIGSNALYWGSSSSVTSSTGQEIPAGACWDFSHATAAVYGVTSSSTTTSVESEY